MQNLLSTTNPIETVGSNNVEYEPAIEVGKQKSLFRIYAKHLFLI